MGESGVGPRRATKEKRPHMTINKRAALAVVAVFGMIALARVTTSGSRDGVQVPESAGGVGGGRVSGEEERRLLESAAAQPYRAAAQHALGIFYFERARARTPPDAVRQEAIERGLAAEDRALAVEGDFVESLIYKNLLLRLQANLEKNPARQQALLKEADTYRNRAEELRKAKAATAATPAAGRGAGRS